MKHSLMKRDPLMMTGIMDPFREIRRMQYDMDRLFSQLLGGGMFTTYGELTPAIESYRKDNNLVIKALLPGIDPKDVDVTFDEDAHQLVIRGERKAEKETKEEEYIHHELEYGTFERRLDLPEGVKTDQLKAKFDKGVLEIIVPAPELKGKKIEIEYAPSEKAAGKKAA